MSDETRGEEGRKRLSRQILAQLDVLNKQATTERSHYYVAATARGAITVIRDQADALDARDAEIARLTAELAAANEMKNAAHAKVDDFAARYVREAKECDALRARLADAHEALAWVLWRHQGGSSVIGQPIRRLFRLGEHQHMTDDMVAAARRFDASIAARGGA